jgi:hypothetical protein
MDHVTGSNFQLGTGILGGKNTANRTQQLLVS